MPRKKGGREKPPTCIEYQFDKRLVAATSVVLGYQSRGPRYAIDDCLYIHVKPGRASRVVAVNPWMMTVAVNYFSWHDELQEATNPGPGKMAFDHSGLFVTKSVSKELLKNQKMGTKVHMYLYDGHVNWFFGESTNPHRVPSVKDGVFPSYLPTVRECVHRADLLMKSDKVPFPLFVISGTALETATKTLSVLTGKPGTQKDESSLLAYGFGNPIEGLFIRYLVDGEINPNIFSIVMAMRSEHPHDTKPSMRDIIPLGLVKKADDGDSEVE